MIQIDGEDDFYMSNRFKDELSLCKEAIELAKNYPQDKELQKLKNNFLEHILFNQLIFLVATRIDCKSCEDSLTEKAESEIKSLIDEL